MDLKFIGAGHNWTVICSQLAHGSIFRLRDHEPGSTATVTTTDPLLACMEGPRWVAEGRFDIGITTPVWHVDMATRGVGYYSDPLPIKVLGVLEHDDYLAFGVKKSTGIRSLAEIAERKLPLRISMPTKATYSPAGYVIEDVFAEYGFTIDDIREWGGEVRIDQPGDLNFYRGQTVEDGFDAVFDEAIMARRWQRIADSNDLRFLPIDADVLRRLEDKGMHRGKIQAGRLRGMDADVETVDFRGWVIYCRADLPDPVAQLVVQALDEGAGRISDQFPAPHLGLSERIDIFKAGSYDLPYHRAAKQYYDTLVAAAPDI